MKTLEELKQEMDAAWADCEAAWDAYEAVWDAARDVYLTAWDAYDKKLREVESENT